MSLKPTDPKPPQEPNKKEQDRSLVLPDSNGDKFKTLVFNIPGMVYRAYPDWSAEIISGSEDICGYTVDELNSKERKWSRPSVDGISIWKCSNESFGRPAATRFPGLYRHNRPSSLRAVAQDDDRAEASSNF